LTPGRRTRSLQAITVCGKIARVSKVNGFSQCSGNPTTKRCRVRRKLERRKHVMQCFTSMKIYSILLMRNTLFVFRLLVYH